tara:strand:+ start:1674 stop:1799 length:126 start_codon:yes stop_codon:yes gene_type:complete
MSYETEDNVEMTDEELAKWYWDNPEAIPDADAVAEYKRDKT